MNNPIIVTGGAGFIGSNFIHRWMNKVGTPVINYDALTYAGNLQNLADITSASYKFVQGDICNSSLFAFILTAFRPSAVINFAAESHVDRSISGPSAFIQTNITGTFNLLETSKAYWQHLSEERKEQFRFLHVSTDEVYGSLKLTDPAFTETNAYAPNSPYSASKASSDHLVRSYYHTYSFPTLTTNCSNNYGPYQFPEKLIPLVICNAINGRPLPIYGKGENIRDWLHVQDHCDALITVLQGGITGETYNIGGNAERTNLQVVNSICNILDKLVPKQTSYHEQITFVTDRPGHDLRYAMDITKIQTQLGWQPVESFETGLQKTVEWYLQNPEWVENVTSGKYKEWITI